MLIFIIEIVLMVFFLFIFKALTLVKTCEPVGEMRECRAPRDWSLLALQNVRTGKSHYLVICRCPDTNILGNILLFIYFFLLICNYNYFLFLRIEGTKIMRYFFN